MMTGRRITLRRAADMTVDEFKEHLKQMNDAVINFDDRKEHGSSGWMQRRRTRTQRNYTRASMRRASGTKWGYTGG